MKTTAIFCDIVSFGVRKNRRISCGQFYIIMIALIKRLFFIRKYFYNVTNK